MTAPLSNGRPYDYGVNGRDAHRVHVHAKPRTVCMADESPSGYVCSRHRGHDGDHAALDIHGAPYSTWPAA